MVNFLFERQQQADGSFPRNSLLNGKLAPDSFNTQLDECSYPILMAWQLGMNDATLYQTHIKPAADFVISHGPSFGPERWEEQGGFSPSTIAAEVAGLIAAADLADQNHDAVSAAIWRGVADEWQRKVELWTVTTNGPLSSFPYFIRLSKTGDPNAAIAYGIGNGGPTLDQRTVIDAGFLELVRLGLKPANDPAVLVSLPVVDATIKTTTSTGDGWHRYNGDGYGDGAGDGHPWAPSGKGTGHLWPLLSEERGEYNLASQNRSGAVSLLEAMLGGSSGVGPGPRAGVGAARSGAVTIRYRPDHRVDRLPQRPSGRLSRAAYLGRRHLRQAVDRHRRQSRDRATGEHGQPLHQPSTGPDRADGDRARRWVQRRHGPGPGDRARRRLAIRSRSPPRTSTPRSKPPR